MKVPGALENVKFSLTSLPISVRPLAAYFIVNNRIYQSPDLYTVVSNRLVSDFEVF
jgi:MED6 mediator sub complex component